MVVNGEQVRVYCESDGIRLINVKAGFNYLDKEDKLLVPGMFFPYASSFLFGIAVVQNDKWEYNYINQKGELLSKNEWFSYASPFNGEFGIVKDNSGKIFHINKDGVLKPC